MNDILTGLGTALLGCIVLWAIGWAIVGTVKSWRKAQAVRAEARAIAGAQQHPVPGPAAGPHSPMRSAPPAPGLHPPPMATFRVWKCGRLRVWDGNNQLVQSRGCDCPTIDWDAAMRRELGKWKT